MSSAMQQDNILDLNMKSSMLDEVAEVEPMPKSEGFFSGIKRMFTGAEAQPEKRQKKKKSKKKMQLEARVNRRNREFKHEVDTNVVSIGLKVLQDDAEINAGDPTECTKCHAMFNKNSILTKPTDEEAKTLEMDEDEQVWNCEFCNHKNVANLEKEEIPTKDAVNYIIENVKADEKKKKSEEDVSIVFCVDLSGSMCVS